MWATAGQHLSRWWGLGEILFCACFNLLPIFRFCHDVQHCQFPLRWLELLPALRPQVIMQGCRPASGVEKEVLPGQAWISSELLKGFRWIAFEICGILAAYSRKRNTPFAGLSQITVISGCIF